MTAQTREILYYKGKIYHLATEPLKQLLELMGDEKLAFVANSTACRRGYVGIWEIVDDKLFLTDLKGRTKDIEEITIDFIFPDQKQVFADRYTGEIKILIFPFLTQAGISDIFIFPNPIKQAIRYSGTFFYLDSSILRR